MAETLDIDACHLLLAYYDNAYRYNLDQRETSKRHHLSTPTPATPETLANRLLEAALGIPA